MNKCFLLSVFIMVATRCMCQSHEAQKVLNKVNDAIVSVYAYGPNQKLLAQGSGVALSRKGWIITNYHLFKRAAQLIIKQKGKNVEYSHIIGMDAAADILILKTGYTFPSINTGNSEQLKSGEKIYAVYASGDGDNTLTDGLLNVSKGEWHFSVALDSGAVGGGVFDSKGELLGIIGRIASGEKQGNRIIPINEALKVYKDKGSDKSQLEAADFFYKGYKTFDEGDYDHAIMNYRKSIDLNPNDIEAYINVGMGYYAKGDYINAVFYEKMALDRDSNLIDMDPHAVDIYDDLALAYAAQAKYDEAITYYQKAVAVNPKQFEAYSGLGMVYAQTGKADSALLFGNKAIEINPARADGYLVLAKGYALKGDSVNTKLNREKAEQFQPVMRK